MTQTPTPVLNDPVLNDPVLMAELMAAGSTWAVVGLSANPRRVAFGVAEVLIEHGIRIVPVHPTASSAHGERGYPTLAAANCALAEQGRRIDVVEMFVRSELVGPMVDQAIEIGAGAVWLQLDVIDRAAARRALDAGLGAVMDRCPAIEGPRLLGW